MNGQLSSYLLVSSALLGFGIYGILSRRNVIAILIAIELILTAATLNFAAMSRFCLDSNPLGQVFVLFIIALAAAEVTVALSIALLLSRKHNTVSIDDTRELKG